MEMTDLIFTLGIILGYFGRFCVEVLIRNGFFPFSSIHDEPHPQKKDIKDIKDMWVKDYTEVK